MRGDAPRSLCRVGDEIVGEETGVGKVDDDGVWGKGEAGGEIDVDAGELHRRKPSASSAAALAGERSSADGLLLGMGDSQGL
jgi:hypothetical protein